MSAARVIASHARPVVLNPITTAGRNARQIHDIAITRTGKPVYRQGGGRSSLGGHTATVFGAAGFLGRYIVNRLARTGCNVVIPYREEMWKRHLKVTGDLGRITFLEFDLRNTESIEESVRHSDIVINLIGRDYETKNFNFWDVHVEGTQRIAEAVAKYDIDRYIHVSSHNADLNSPSAFFRTKAEGELEARAIFPETTIVRPARVWGEEDRLLLFHAQKRYLITSNNLQERFRPVHSIDVGRALERIAYDDSTVGQTYELFGPKEYSMGEIREMVKNETKRNLTHINVPKKLQQIYRAAWEYVWWPLTSVDEVEREFIDHQIDPTAKTFADLGMDKVDDIGEGMLRYIRHFRSNKYYDLPPMTEKEREEERKYWHVQDDIYH
ncbi:NADH-ubiquinone oxidoreductase 40 kDa subunit [Orbilia oligospora]|uniref:NADH-ubiquinone oxidoreductase 40 kDa subunit n=2 Tax=Orbilia oligospora TaxID=2813651 RepID=A0A7C8U5I7_ORBOL|nr:NADH-ubiquinone oxidoreductase 40 kDa subunit [Orbilia oligospora]KAF3107744.1 NADH-ubiquinone oxidoreductase 40 kDa subunit [Orbilia oligospora]KAF3114120.1 NADH-ubiquinone oxidoreductase 40 kDa subunit [Orbilia oligospora]KAF3136559.1 NADH-ubiquinone oxidoreductase 40 kDa subunit [Orbilia oligospora]KAF3179495.1 NADH-ubiquinone oxidoreductase 40 kDa subunit [Orbilia oligospora]